MKIFRIESGPVETLGYLAMDENSQKGLIIDVPLESADFFLEKIREFNIELEYILLTHSHWDHSGEAALLKRETGASVCIHKADNYRLTDPMGNSVFALPFEIEPVEADRFLDDGEIVECGSLRFETRHTPGHTEGSLCFVEHAEKIIFSGDTIFSGSIGRTDLPGGSTEQILDSIDNKILTLPDNFNIFCGHGPDTNVGKERMDNPFLNKSYNM